MTTARKRYDLKDPGSQQLMRQIRYGAFVSEGTLVAFPMCFPGVTTPIPGDESHVTALDTASDRNLYGGCGGRRAHVFCASLHGAAGIVFDLGVIEGADACPAVCCGLKGYAACANGPGGSRIVGGAFAAIPGQLLQEWAIERPPMVEYARLPKGERILHAIALPDRSAAIGVTDQRLFRIDFEGKSVEWLDNLAGAGRIACDAGGRIFGFDGDSALWTYDSGSGDLKRKAISLPKDGKWSADAGSWAWDGASGRLYLSDATGLLFAMDESGSFSGPLGRTPLAPVGPMSATHDGRLFGFCGPEISHLFVCDPSAREVRDLGVAVSAIERRRYGYKFGAAASGRDGQIFFGEDDDLGHLWIYFPPIRER